MLLEDVGAGETLVISLGEVVSELQLLRLATIATIISGKKFLWFVFIILLVLLDSTINFSVAGINSV